MSDFSKKSDIFDIPRIHELPMATIRPATQADQPTITAMVRGARLNPINLRWPNFLVAEESGRIVGVGQLRPHADGSRELASLAVDAAYRRQGIGSQLVRQLLTCHPAPIYLFCESELEGYYSHFGFRITGAGTLPPPLARLFRVGRLFTRVGALLLRDDVHLIAMRWDGDQQA
jgi:N-acetylglutamate synthase-like GNAT family acetyltransferase